MGEFADVIHALAPVAVVESKLVIGIDQHGIVGMGNLASAFTHEDFSIAGDLQGAAALPYAIPIRVRNSIATRKDIALRTGAGVQ